MIRWPPSQRTISALVIVAAVMFPAGAILAFWTGDARWLALCWALALFL